MKRSRLREGILDGLDIAGSLVLFVAMSPFYLYSWIDSKLRKDGL